MVPSRFYFIIPDLVLSEEVIENLFNQFSLQLNTPDGCLSAFQLGSAFSAVLTFVRDSYKASHQGRENESALTEQDLKNQIKQLSNEKQQLANEKQQLTNEKQLIQQTLGYKKSTSARLKLELAEARTKNTEAVILSNTTRAENQFTSTMLKKAETQVVDQGKLIDRLLINGVSRLMSESDDPLCGSISKSMLWQTQQNVPGNEFSVPLKRLELPQHSDPAAIQAKCQVLQSIEYPKEPPMYKPFTDFLKDYLSDTEFIVFNTSQFYYLDGLAPDITISLPGVAVADAMAMVLFVELKARDEKVLGSDHNLGQVYEYLLAAARCQRERTKFAGILSNFKQNIAVVLTRTRTRAYLTHYIGTNMHTILRFVTLILQDADYQPPELGFSKALGPMLGRLGHPCNSIVGEFALLESFPPSVTVLPLPIPNGLIKAGSEPARMAVKRPKYDTPAALNPEVNVLLEIRRRTGHPNLPYIVMLSEDHSEVGILPIGAPISASTLSIPGIGSTIIGNILDALTFLHAQNIVHRDVRTANVILHGRTAVLIDFDAATPAGVLTTHRGGFICTPQAVLRRPNEKYIPKPADDFLAVVLMANSLLFPYAYRSFQSKNLSDHESEEHGRLMALWAALKASIVWGPLVAAAESEQVGILKAGLQALMVTL